MIDDRPLFVQAVTHSVAAFRLYEAWKATLAAAKATTEAGVQVPPGDVYDDVLEGAAMMHTEALRLKDCLITLLREIPKDG